MKKTWFRYSILFAFVLMLAACAVQKEIEIEVLKPAEMSLPVYIKRVLLVDNSKPQPKNEGNYFLHKTLNNSLKVRKLERILRQDTLELDSLGISCIYNLANGLMQSEFLDTVIVLRKLANKGQGILMPKQVKELADSFGVDAIISLDNLMYESVVEYATWYKELYGLAAFTSYNTLWRFYDGKTLELIDREEFSDTLYYDVSYNDFSNKGFVEAMVSETVWAAGAASAQKIYPWWKQVSRVFFESGSPDLRIAAKYYNKGDYDNAAKYWLLVYENYNGKNRARGAFNLALFSEINGNLEKALEYLQIARFIYEDSNVLLKTNPEYLLIKSYYDVITQRIDDDEKLF